MFKIAVFLSLVALVASQASNTSSIRFVNAVEGATTLTFYTDALADPVTVNSQQASAYFQISGGIIKINNVLDQNGNSLNNGNPIQTTFGPYHTLIALNNAASNNAFTLVLINETNGADIDANPDNTKAYIRLVDLSQAASPAFITLASTGGAVASYVGFLAPTAFVTIAPSTTSLRFYDSQNGNYNTPSLTINTSFQALHAYTVFFFVNSNTSVQTATVVDDRTVGAAVATTGAPVTSTSTTGAPATSTSTTGAPVTSTTGVPATSTTGVPVTSTTTTGAIGTGNANNENSAVKATAFGMVTLLAVAALF